MNISNLYNWLLNLGVSSELPDSEIRIIKMQNRLTTVSALLLSTFPIFFLVLQLKSGLLLCALGFLIIFLGYLFNYLRLYVLGRVTPIVLSPVLFILCIYYYGSELGFEFGLMAVMVLPVLYFYEKGRYILIYAVLIPAVVFAIYWISLNGAVYQIDPANHPFIRTYLFSSCFFLVLFYFLAMRKVNEEFEIKNEELVKSLYERNEEMESFSYLASHDMKQPIRTIINFADLMDSKLEDGTAVSEHRKFLALIKNAGIRLNGLIESILNYNVIGKTIDIEEVNVQNLIKDILVDLDALINEKSAQIKVGVLPVIRADRLALTSIFQNLITNGIKFSKMDVVPMLQILSKETAKDFIFIVKDNGIGFNPEYASKVFKLFQRLDQKENVKGTGIGLAHCKKIVESHGGRIWVDPRENLGSTFYFSIPKVIK